MSHEWLKAANKNKRLETLNKISNKTFHEWKVIGSYIDQKRRILCKCSCGTESLVSVTNLLNGTSKCCGCLTKKHRKDTMLKKHGVEYSGQTSKTKKSKKQQSQTLKDLWILNNKGKLFGDWVVIGGEIVNEKVLVRCKCGIEKTIRIYKLTNGGSKGCQKCAGKKIKQTLFDRYGTRNVFAIPHVSEKMIKKTGASNPFSSEIIKNQIIKKLTDNNNRSNGEIELCQWIESLGFQVKKSYIGGSNPREIDIYIPEKNVYIEYNGDYWHSEAAGKTRQYHLDKTIGCLKQNNTHLIHIFESEWKEKQEIIKNFLLSKLNKGVPVRASQCNIKEITKEEAIEFCQKYHLQGKKINSILNIGLYKDDELLSVMVFSNPHRQNMEKIPHLSRYAIKPGYRIHGGLSKMSMFAYERLNKFITYVHYRLSDGKSYEKSGYKKLKTTKPDYWYVNISNNQIISKQSRKKLNVNTPEGMTEKEHAILDNLYRIWDCGKIKFIYDPDNY
jgi:hypothetical protein